MAASVAIVAMLAFAVACAASAYQRADWMAGALGRQGFMAWPGGPESGDSGYVWLHAAGRFFRLVAYDRPHAGLFVFPVGFAAYMAGMAWLLRGTAIPYLLAVGSIVFSLLTTGGIRGHDALPSGFLVDAQRRIYGSEGAEAPLCGVRSFAMDRRAGARGPSYWIVGHLMDGVDTDLYVFDTEPQAATLLHDTVQLWAAACARVAD